MTSDQRHVLKGTHLAKLAGTDAEPFALSAYHAGDCLGTGLCGHFLAYGQGLGGSVLHAFMNMGNNVIVMWPGQTSLQAGGQRAGQAGELRIRRCARHS